MTDILEQARKFYAEIVKSDGGESEQMAMLRELCDEIVRLKEQLRVVLKHVEDLRREK